ncbi:hypothetical protein [Paenibacillus antarcticus]|uniref:Uncharacterized protein n=1 Tax=Paenibacillus antarcticus TaxID=253703 RepID=A0A168Q0J0_9BACL|nr:hypothetical protein [Paenibacillus antarcticus]OAB47257.1 hypothetical protein PBAT_05990 [Paenibacillus antarcticus]
MVSLIFIIYILLSGAIIKIIYRDSLRDWSLKWLIVTALPVIGWLFPVFWPKRWFQSKSEGLGAELFEDAEEPLMQMNGIYNMVEVEKELNVIPIEEALIVNEYAARRTVMINVLKQDSMNYMDILQKAVSNEDTETSHYAVSAIMEMKRKLTLSLEELSLKYESNKDDAHILRTYSDVLSNYMKSGFLDERTLRKYKFTYILVLDQLITILPEDDSAYIEKVDTELEVGALLDAEKTALLYLNRRPHSEEAYLCLLKVYFYMKSYSRLQEILNSLKSSPISLSNRALTLVRFWSEGA